jgi:glycerophosphoryl diester phosphodiesterase
MVESTYFEGKQPRIIAHRGLFMHREGVSENTLESFLEAIGNGATHLETDVQATSDGHAVLFHDSDLSRVSSSSSSVTKLTLAELQSIQLKNGGRVPTLAEVLVALPEAKLNLDIKSQTAVSATIAAIEQNKAHHRVLITSFSNSRRLATLAGLSKPALSSSSALMVLRVWLSHYVLFGIGLKRQLRGISALQIPVRKGPLRFDGKSFIARVSNLGLELHYWTINDVYQMRKLIELGAHGIVTDRVDLVPREFLRED